MAKKIKLTAKKYGRSPKIRLWGNDQIRIDFSWGVRLFDSTDLRDYWSKPLIRT